MTTEQRTIGLKRIKTLTTRNYNLGYVIKASKLSTVMENEIIEQITENQDIINRLEKSTSAKYTFLFNFESGGWNSEYAHTKEEAIELAKDKYNTKDYKGTCIPDITSFRVSTPTDYNNLLSLFY